MTRRHRIDRLVGLAALAGTATVALGQDEDLTRPPRLEEGPGDARIEPPAEERRESLEEVIVVGREGWRLPDLGSDWRAQREEETDTGRIEANFLPLYDPENPTSRSELFMANREMQRVGFIELFRIRFGGRTTD